MRIQLKRSNTLLENGSAKPPSSEQMEYGELAVNFNNDDPAIFFKDSESNIIRISGAGAIGSGTAQLTLDAGPGLYITNPVFTLDQTADQTIDIDLVLETSDELVGLEFASNKLRAKKASSTELGTIKEPSGIGVFMRQVTADGEQWVNKDATVALPSGYPDLSDGAGNSLDGRYLKSKVSQIYTGNRLTINQNLTVGNDLDANKINASGTITGDVTGDLTGNADTATNATNAANATNANTAANLSRSVIAGDGLTGGGEMTADRTIDVGAADATIIVEADGIRVDQSNLNFTDAAKDGQININASNGLEASGNNATANQGGDTTRTISGIDATTSEKGVVKLNDTNSSTSTTVAATANAAKKAYDRVASYAPEKDGTNATGTWDIDITGNAATADVAASVTGNIATATLADKADRVEVKIQPGSASRPIAFFANWDSADESYLQIYRAASNDVYINPGTGTLGATTLTTSGNINVGSDAVVTGDVVSTTYASDGNITIKPRGTTDGRGVNILPGQGTTQGGSIIIGAATEGEGGSIIFRGYNTSSTNKSYSFCKVGDSTIKAFLNFNFMTQSRTYSFPDTGGTLALTSDTVSNADKLNGLTSDQFLRSDVDDTMAGSLYFQKVNYFTNSGTGAKFNDNTTLRFGTTSGSDMYSNGNNLFLDLGAAGGGFYIRDGTTSRYTFNDNGNFTATGNITAPNFTGTASQATLVGRGTWSGASSWRALAVWSNTSDGFVKLQNGTAGTVEITGSGKLRTAGDASIGGKLTTSGNIQCNGSLSATLNNGDVRNAMATSGAGNKGTFAALTTNNSNTMNAGETRSGSNLRYCSFSGSANNAPSGTWRLMGRSSGNNNNWTEDQGSIWLRSS